MTKPNSMRFANFAGTFQFVVRDDADLAKIDALDPARWAATSAPLADFQCDPAFATALDPDGTGRVRVSQLIGARDWLFARLSTRTGLTAKSDVLTLGHLDTSSEAGAKLRAAAKRVIKARKLENTAKLPLTELRAYREAVMKTLENGDGIVPPEVVPETEVAQLIKDIVATTGGSKDGSGSDGVGQADLDKFVARANVWLEWRAKRASVVPWGDDTEAAAAMIASLDGKIEEFFWHCDLLRQQGTEALHLKEDELRALSAKDAAAIEKYMAESPLATPVGTGILAFGEGGQINPVYRASLEALRAGVLSKTIGPAARELTRAAWRETKAIFAGFMQWQKDKPAEPFDAIGEDKLKALLAGPLPARIAHFIGVDKAVADNIAQLAELDKLIVMQRWLIEMVNNFVNFSSVYHPEATALVEMGSLVIDGRRLDFCLKVANTDAHKKLAAESLIYLVYASITDKEGAAPAYTVVAPVTAGGRGRLRVGKRGIFIDIKGKEWDAQVTSVAENPISVVEAMFAPFRKLSQMVSKKIEDWIGSAQADQEKAMTASADKAVVDAQKGAEKAAKDVAAAKAPPPAAPPPPAAAPPPLKAERKGLDVNSLILGGGIAIAGISSVLAAIFGLFTSLAGILAIAGIIAFVLGLSALIGWLKLRKRDMSLIFEASGWAMNITMTINRGVARLFTFTPHLPAGAVLDRIDTLETAEDRAERRRQRVRLVLVNAAALIAIYWYVGAKFPHPAGLSPYLHAWPVQEAAAPPSANTNAQP